VTRMRVLSAILVWGVLVCPVVLHGATVTWDDGGPDKNWSTADNWDGNGSGADGKPGTGDTVIIATGDSVLCDIGNWPGGMDVTLSGGSDLAQSVATLRMSSSSLHVGSGSTLSGGFWDLGGADITFENGAAATMSAWEQKFNNSFTFELGPSGFTTLTPGSLAIAGHNNTTMSNATYIVDMANYTGGAAVIPLVDFTSDGSGTTAETFQWATLIVTNAGTYPDPAICWNDSDDVIELAPYGGGLAWDGEAGDGLWRNPTNWNTDVLPGTGETIAIGNGDTVEWDAVGGQSLPGGLTVNLSGNSTLHSSAVLRMSGSTINVGAGCSLTSDVNDWFDLGGGTVNFEDGATNTVYYWEQKGNITLGFTLGETGFTALEPVQLRSGNSATWSNATLNVDISAYDRSNGKTITLIDWGSHHANFTDTFDGVTANITGHEGGSLSWDTSESQLILHVVPLQGSIMIVR
jgi:hypothetical protein